MKKFIIVHTLIVLFSLLIMPFAAATAASISYDLTDLSSQQQDLWQIDYQVSGFDSDAYNNFQIFFDYDKFEDISLGAYTPGWDPRVSQPDIILGHEDNGILDVLVTNPGGILSASFSVKTVWLGSGMPGAQQFELIDSGTWDVVGSGTTSPVPIPGAIVLLFSGLAGLVAGQRKFKKN